MSVNFTSNPEQIKNNTAREGDGIGLVAAPQNLGSGNPAPYYEVTVDDKPGSGSDNTISHAGPESGVVNGIGSSPNDIQGFTSTTGNKVIVDSTFGSDSITIQHHSGASIIIDGDGAIHIISSGKKGVGLISPKGDLTIFARNHVILKGESKITLESQGDIDLNVGGNLGFHVKGDMITSVQGSLHTSVDGAIIIETAKDASMMIAGDSRLTAAGDIKMQSSSGIALDAGQDINIRSDGNFAMNAQETATISSKGNMAVNTEGTHNTRANGDMNISTKSKLATKSSGITKISSTGALSLNTSASASILGSGAININGSSTTVQVSGSPSVDAADTPEAAALAQYAPVETIIDSITTTRIAPDFPSNAKRMSAEEMSLYSNDGTAPNPKAIAAAVGNKGAGVPVTLQGAGTAEPVASSPNDIPAGISTSNGKSEQNPLTVPSSIFNSSQKISRHFTVGHIVGLRKAPGDISTQQAILKEAMNTAWNILDPLVEKYGSRFQITSWYRPVGSPNHVTGGAVDFRAAVKHDTSLTGELATFIRDYLPYKQLFLEKNDSPGIHCHVWAAPAGSGASGNVLTCTDQLCKNKVPGLQLTVAQAALQKAGGRIA